MPCTPSGCSPSSALGVHSAGCCPAAWQAASSCSGMPSLVTAPLNSLSASASPAASSRCTRWMWPEAPSPSRSAMRSRPQAMRGSDAGVARCQPSGLPARASQARRGSPVSQPGSSLKRLADRRSNSRHCALASPGGSAARQLPASMSFCSAGRWPSSAGSCSMALSVRMSQRSLVGSAAAGTCWMRLALKPTISSAGQSPSDAGRWVKWLLEQKTIFSRCSRPRSGGSSRRRLPVRLSTSSVSARSNTSGGSSVRPQLRSSRRVPASAPLRSCSRVCMQVDGEGPPGWAGRNA
ncbi:hypothetical protein FQZ97_853800 [compost metagenome]